MTITDESRMWFGEHQGKKMEDVPDSYLMWFWSKNANAYKNGWMRCEKKKALMDYIADNLDSLDKVEE